MATEFDFRGVQYTRGDDGKVWRADKSGYPDRIDSNGDPAEIGNCVVYRWEGPGGRVYPRVKLVRQVGDSGVWYADADTGEILGGGGGTLTPVGEW